MRASIAAVALISFVAGHSALAQTPDEMQAAAARVVRRHNIQAELPNDQMNEGWSLSLPDVDVSTWLLWCAIAIGLVTVLYPLRDQLFFRRAGSDEDWEGAGGSAGPSTGPRQSLASVSEDADELARQGRFMEAIHLLLLHALMEMRQRLKAQFADSLTSREILRAADLPAEGTTALQDMISQVERSYFGEYPAAADDYAACRSSFDRFVHHLQAAGARR
jgi:hypothetical protein